MGLLGGRPKGSLKTIGNRQWPLTAVACSLSLGEGAFFVSNFGPGKGRRGRRSCKHRWRIEPMFVCFGVCFLCVYVVVEIQ